MKTISRLLVIALVFASTALLTEAAVENTHEAKPAHQVAKKHHKHKKHSHAQ